MDKLPTSAPNSGEDRSIVDEAEMALRAFGENLSRPHAATLIQLWHRRPELTDLEVAAVLDRFRRP